MFLADLVFSVLTQLLGFIFTELASIPLTLLQQFFGTA